MSETQETQASAAEIQQVMTELEAYKQRIVDDALSMAKKVKISKKAALEHLKTNPEIIKIETALQQLQTQLSASAPRRETKLSDKVKELILKARIVSFASWESSQPPEYIQIFQQADDEGRYLTDSDLEQIQSAFTDTAKFLRDNAPEIVAEARTEVLKQYPHITDPRGDLYPPERAEACWRDFWHFLRCITYGVTGQNPQFTSEEGLKHMELLYQELGVPLKAMVLGLECLKTASLKRLPQQQDSLSPYFDHLIGKLKSFK